MVRLVQEERPERLGLMEHEIVGILSSYSKRYVWTQHYLDVLHVPFVRFGRLRHSNRLVFAPNQLSIRLGCSHLHLALPEHAFVAAELVHWHASEVRGPSEHVVAVAQNDGVANAMDWHVSIVRDRDSVHELVFCESVYDSMMIDDSMMRFGHH